MRAEWLPAAGVMRAAWPLAAIGTLAACTVLPPDLMRVGRSPTETAEAVEPAVPGPEQPGAERPGSAAVSFTVVPDQTARASWSAPPTGSE